MGCVYVIYDKKSGKSEKYTYEELVEKFKDNYSDFADVLYSKGNNKVSKTLSELNEKRKEYRLLLSQNKFNPDPTIEGTLSPQSFIDSGKFRAINGEQVIPEKSDQNYIENMMLIYMQKFNMTEAEARQKAETTVSNWETVNGHAKEFHILLNSFDWRHDGQMDFMRHLRGTSFENFANSIWESIMGEKGLYHIMRSAHKMTDDFTTAIVTGVNLKAKLSHLNQDIIGHYDNLIIDTDGTLHVYNYKITSTPVEEWDYVKKLKYYYEMALLRLILAYNGFNVRKTQLHIIPIKLDYSDDFSALKGVNILVKPHITTPVGEAFIKESTMAKYYIKSNVKLDPINSLTKTKINKNLNTFFPQRNVALQGISKSAEEWIKFNYSDKHYNKIKKVNASDHVYEIYFNDDGTDPVLITENNPPLQNALIREAVINHLNESNEASSEFLNKLIDEIRASRRAGTFISTSNTKNRNLQISKAFLDKSLRKYISSYRVVLGEKVYDWDLIENDTLLDANILLFKNKSGLVDVVCLSNYNTKSELRFNGLKNIMGSYVPDISPDTQGLINYRANFGNIEAVRVMTILNEVLPQLNDSDMVLGDLRVISMQSKGMMELFHLESLNKNLFLPIIKIVKKNVNGFLFTNNFSNSKYVDPLVLLHDAFEEVTGSDSIMSNTEKQQITNLGFDNLTSLGTREQKSVLLRAMIERMYELYPALQTMSPSEIIRDSKENSNPQYRAIDNLYIACQLAFGYYSGIEIANEYKISSISEYAYTQNRVPNHTYQNVVTMFTLAVDNIAAKVRSDYNQINKITMDFYDAQGYGRANTSLIGNQASAFNNLYERNDLNQIIMKFRNPYKTDTFKPMSSAERTYLKRVLFEFARIRSLIYGFDFNFTKNDIDSDRYKDFIEKNKHWYFNPPLERASKATKRTKGVKSLMEEWVKNAKEVIKDPKKAFTRVIEGFGTFEEAELMESAFDSLVLSNPYIMSDGYLTENSRRTEMIESHPIDFFETNVENLLAHYLEKSIQTTEFNKTLIATKGILLELSLLGDTVGNENRAGIELTIDMIKDFVKQNIFNVSLLEPSSKKVMTWIEPFRKLVSDAYIAGNIISMFRDTFEGMWQNTARMLTKYQTDIDASSLSKAYKEVTKASFTDIRTITIIDELCKTYRLSNLDVARISEGLTTSRGGFLNVENWLYSTLRAPDFLNRMVLFVAKCMKDGCWDAFSIKDGKLVYDWKKDKRYSIYADESKKGTKEYEELKIAYYNAVRQYNLDNPDTPIDFDKNGKGLPVAYSNDEILQMRNLSNSIYGAYDKSMRAKYEHTALGLTFAMFSTWMNGIVSNYFTQPGQYSGSPTTLELDSDGSGNLLFLDKDGREVVRIESESGVTYEYRYTGEPYSSINELVPVMKNVPLVIQGVWYTLKDTLSAISKCDEDGNWIGKSKFIQDIWANPVQRKNLAKAGSDLLGALLFFLLFKFAVDPAYNDYKKHMTEHSLVTNTMAEVLYKSTSRSYDGFLGPIAPLLFAGSSTNPPMYTLSTKLASDLFKATFGDKTYVEVATGNISLLKFNQDSLKAERKKSESEKSETK